MDSLVNFTRGIIISFTLLILSLIDGAKGTLTPDGTVSLDCGSQQTFTCIVTGGVAGWTISGLSGISLYANSALSAANNNPRITTTDTSGTTLTSTITITGFNTADNGGTIQCIDLDYGSVQGIASVSVGIPSCPSSVVAVSRDSIDAITVTWEQPLNTPAVTFTAVIHNCSTSSPNCGNSRTLYCTISPCTISGLDTGTEYQVTVIPYNNCGSPTRCTGNSATAQTTCISLEALLLAGIIPSVVLLLSNIITLVVAVLVTRYCCNSRSPPKVEEVYEQVEGPCAHEDIPMSTNPAYGQVIQK